MLERASGHFHGSKTPPHYLSIAPSNQFPLFRTPGADGFTKGVISQQSLAPVKDHWLTPFWHDALPQWMITEKSKMCKRWPGRTVSRLLLGSHVWSYYFKIDCDKLKMYIINPWATTENGLKEQQIISHSSGKIHSMSDTACFATITLLITCFRCHIKMCKWLHNFSKFFWSTDEEKSWL